MFNKNNRYMTRGIKETLDISLQMMLWKMVDDLKESKEIELDYLQVFKIRRNNEELVKMAKELTDSREGFLRVFHSLLHGFRNIQRGCFGGCLC